MLLDSYAPLKKVNKNKMKFKSKPWITLGLQKSISVKSKLLKNFINKGDRIIKEEFRTYIFTLSYLETYSPPL